MRAVMVGLSQRQVTVSAVVLALTVLVASVAVDVASAAGTHALSVKAAHKSRLHSQRVTQHLRSLAHSGAFTTAKAHALLDHMMHAKGGATFEGYEHAYGSGYGAAGTADAITFQYIKSRAVATATTADRILVSDDGVAFSYSDMTASAGDFWAPKDKNENIICNLNVASKKTPIRQATGQTERFNRAFNDMWHNPDFGANARPVELSLNPLGTVALVKTVTRNGWMNGLQKQINDMIAAEEAGVHAAGWGAGAGNRDDAERLHPGSRYYEGSAKGALGAIKQMASETIRANPLFQSWASALSEGNGRALQFNDDHFWRCAHDSYSFGHKLAVAEAHAAGTKYRALTAASTDAEYAVVANSLIRAYAKDGFVSHFLSDSFSSGHLRTPRVELRTACDGTTNGAKSAGLTANVMHDEDNWNCVLVTNKRDDRVPNKRDDLWWACGDHRFFDQENGMNRRMLHDAIAASVGEVSAAFEAGRTGGVDPSSVPDWVAAGMLYVGSTEHLTERQAVENTCPLYMIDKAGRLHQRKGFGHKTGFHAFPRPVVAQEYFPYGSSLRWLRSSLPFPPFRDLKHNPMKPDNDLADSNETFRRKMTTLVPRLNHATKEVVDAAITCAGQYRPFARRGIRRADRDRGDKVARNDCCVIASRSTPELVAQSHSPFDDVSQTPATKWPSSFDALNMNKRVTYVNTCFVTQKIVKDAEAKTAATMGDADVIAGGATFIGKAIADDVKLKVGVAKHVTVESAKAVADGAKIVGNAAVAGGEAIATDLKLQAGAVKELTEKSAKAVADGAKVMGKAAAAGGKALAVGGAHAAGGIVSDHARAAVANAGLARDAVVAAGKVSSSVGKGFAAADERRAAAQAQAQAQRNGA